MLLPRAVSRANYRSTLYDIMIFFFKQKTAYEGRICDWSSDVCSSDLLIGRSATDEARRLVGQRVNELHEIIEGIRDEVIAENGWQWREGCTEDEEDAGIDLNDTLARDTLSVVGAIKAVEASA